MKNKVPKDYYSTGNFSVDFDYNKYDPYGFFNNMDNTTKLPFESFLGNSDQFSSLNDTMSSLNTSMGNTSTNTSLFSQYLDTSTTNAKKLEDQLITNSLIPTMDLLTTVTGNNYIALTDYNNLMITDKLTGVLSLYEIP